MTIVDVNPLVMKDVEASIADDDFRKALSKVELTPSSSAISWSGLGGNTHTDGSTATWTANLTYVQDWDSPESFSRYLFEHEGETKTFEFAPRSGVGPTFAVDIVLTPGAIGGAVNAFAETSVALGCNGRPVLVDRPIAP